MEEATKLDRRQFNTGRPPLGDGPSARVSLKMTREQKDKLIRLGGAVWIRSRIDKAQEK